jgi:predicted PurR-regulated permease PerM
VRNVARGVLGTALIQSILAGLGLVLADVPGAAILTLVCFLLCVVQIGPAIVLIGAIAYLFSTAPMTVAILFTVLYYSRASLAPVRRRQWQRRARC